MCCGRNGDVAGHFECDGENEAEVVISVLANQIDTARRADRWTAHALDENRSRNSLYDFAAEREPKQASSEDQNHQAAPEIDICVRVQRRARVRIE